MKLSNVAREAIRLADAKRNYWDAELRRRHPDYPLMRLSEYSGPPPPEKEELRELLSNLPDHSIYLLLLVMYLGRGDFGTQRLSAHYRKLRKTFRKPQSAVSQMAGKTPLGDFLSDGLEKLNRAGIDLDELDAAPARPRG